MCPVCDSFGCRGGEHTFDKTCILGKKEPVMPKELKTMSAGDLRKLLAGVNDDVKVGFEVPSGDITRTVLLGTIRKAEHAIVKWSEYHQCFKVLDADDEEKEEFPETLPGVLLLS